MHHLGALPVYFNLSVSIANLRRALTFSVFNLLHFVCSLITFSVFIYYIVFVCKWYVTDLESKVGDDLTLFGLACHSIWFELWLTNNTNAELPVGAPSVHSRQLWMILVATGALVMFKSSLFSLSGSNFTWLRDLSPEPLLWIDSNTNSDSKALHHIGNIDYLFCIMAKRQLLSLTLID